MCEYLPSHALKTADLVWLEMKKPKTEEQPEEHVSE